MMRPGGKVKVVSRSRAAVELDCVDWAEEIAQTYSPDLIVFLAKSGFLFALPIAQVLGCDVVDLKVERPGNSGKDALSKLAPVVPKPLLGLALKSRFMYGFNDANSARSLSLTPRSEAVDFSCYKRILLVDDSVDTGWSVLRASDYLAAAASQAEVRIASYCVIGSSDDRVRVDYRRFSDTIVLTATSRFSKEYMRFLDDYRNWSEAGEVGAA